MQAGQKLEIKNSFSLKILEYDLFYQALQNSGLWGIFKGSCESTLRLKEGGSIELGREFRTTDFSLRNNKHQGHLMWSKTDQSTALKAKGFTLERGLVGRRQVLLRHVKEGFILQQLHQHSVTRQ